MSKVAFVIMAHRNPRQLSRLVHVLGPGRCVVHLDAAVDAVTYAARSDGFGGARLAPRLRTPWGSWQIVEAILGGCVTALADPAVTHVAVVSGQDYPLVPTATMDDRLAAGRSSLHTVRLPQRYYGRRGGFDRLQDLHWLVAGHKVRVPSRRKLPAQMKPFVSSTWSIYARSHVQLLASAAAEQRRWWNRVWIPDELFTACVLGSRCRDELDHVEPSYTEWAGGSPHPRTFAVADVDRVAAMADQANDLTPGRKWFARKFDDDDGSVFRALIDRLVGATFDDDPLGDGVSGCAR